LELDWGEHGGVRCLRLSGLSSRALTILRETGDFARGVPVYPSAVVRSRRTAAALQPVAGGYHLDGGAVCFTPRFPFADGTSYTVLVHPSLTGGDADSEPTALTIERPRRQEAATATVVEIHPSSPVVPRNLLRFYVHFSEPMSEGEAGHVRIQRADTGDELAAALLPMDPELWDRDRRRLTVLLDPARIKRGLASHRELGYPLEEGLTFELVVDARFRDARGRHLVRDGVRRFEVGPDVRARVDPAQWELEVPAAGARDGLVVRFPRPLDHALLGHCIRVVDGRGRRIPGATDVAPGDRSWSFVPSVPWRAERYELLVDTMLEDLAGNSVARVFDRDLSRPDDDPVPVGRVALALRPG
jgi:hypothetical protein